MASQPVARAHRPDSELPLIAVGVTCFNAEATIVEALRSAQAQDWPSLEIVVVDDASTDRSLEILTDFARTDFRMRVVSLQSNMGVGYARNQILSATDADYIAFFDDDDISKPSRLRAHWEIHVQHQSVHFGCTRIVSHVSREAQTLSGRQATHLALGSDLSGRGVSTEKLVRYGITNTGNLRKPHALGTGAMMTTRSAIESIGGFDSGMRRLEDIDAVVRLRLAGGCVVGSQELALTHRQTRSEDKSYPIMLEAQLALQTKHSALVGSWRHVQALQMWTYFIYSVALKRYAVAGLYFAGAVVLGPLQTVQRLWNNLLPRVAQSWAN